MKAVIQKLGYPTRQTFYQWLREKNNPVKKVKPPRKRINNSPDHPLHPSPELKLIRTMQVEIDILNEEVKILKKDRSGINIHCRNFQGKFDCKIATITT